MSSHVAIIIEIVLNLVAWLALAVVRDFAAIMREDQVWNTPSWNHYNDLWHRTGALNRAQTSFVILHLGVCVALDQNIFFMLNLWVIAMVAFWLVFDIGLNILRNKPEFKVGQSAWLDKKINALATVLNWRSDRTGIVVKFSLFIPLLILLYFTR